MNENKNEKQQVKRQGVYTLFANGKARFIAMVMALSALMSISAFAADETATGMDAVVSSVDTLGTLMTKVWTLMTSNPLLTLFLAVALLSVGVSVFGMIKHAAHR